jgi:hypothetical protein
LKLKLRISSNSDKNRNTKLKTAKKLEIAVFRDAIPSSCIDRKLLQRNLLHLSWDQKET